MELTYLLLFLIFYYMIKKKNENPLELFQSLFNNPKVYSIKGKKEKYPILLTDFRYSEAFKLGFELSKIFPLKYMQSEGMYQNIHKIVNYPEAYQLALCTENDIFEKLKSKTINPNDLKVVCSFYRMEMIFIVHSKFRVNSIKDFINLIERKVNVGESIKMGVLDTKHSSYYDLKKILNSFGLSEDTNGLNIEYVKSMKELFFKFDDDNYKEDEKENVFDVIFLTTTSKNKFLTEYLKKNFVNVIGVSTKNDSILKSNFDCIFRQRVKLEKYNRITKDNNDLFSYTDSDLFGKNLDINTYSTRLFLVTNSNMPNDLIYSLLETIYKNRIKLKENMDNYLLNYKNNRLDKLMDPYEMFFIKETCSNNFKYHPGAVEYYKKIGFITHDKNKFNTITSNVKSKLLHENNGPMELVNTKGNLRKKSINCL